MLEPEEATTVSGAANCGTTNWLSALAQQSPLETPNTVIVSVSTTGMTAGTCTGTVRLAYNGVSGATETDVQVTLFVSSSALLSLSLPQGFGLATTAVGFLPTATVFRTCKLLKSTIVTVSLFSFVMKAYCRNPRSRLRGPQDRRKAHASRNEPVVNRPPQCGIIFVDTGAQYSNIRSSS